MLKISAICGLLILVGACAPVSSPGSTAASPVPMAVASPSIPVASKSPALSQIDSVRQQILDLTNAERVKAGLSTLSLNTQLDLAAQGHAENMARQTKLEHSLDGKTFSQRIEAAGYDYMQVAENLYFGSSVPQEVVEAWMNSEGHRKNILTADLKELGVGFAISDVNKRGYWVQNFGTAF